MTGGSGSETVAPFRSVNTEIVGRNIYKTLIAVIQKKNLPDPIPSMLGLAAGMARAEQALAESMGAQEGLTLVDTQFHDVATGNYIPSDLFEFLETWDGQKFGIITLISGEHIIANFENLTRFFQLLPNVAAENCYVVIAPTPLGLQVPEMYAVIYSSADSLILQLTKQAA